jgi:site-specific DNA-methyltransferase (adenine-specific)
LPHQLVVAFDELFVLQNTLHWIKSITVQTKKGDLISAGHFKPINSPRFITDCHEYLFHFTRSGSVPIDRLAVGVPYEDKSNVARWGHTDGKDCRCRGNNWFIPYKTINSRDKQRPHPATFPTELAEMCYKLHGVGPDTVALDPFVGIGHSGIAAQNCGIGHFIGMDIDEGFIEEARKRLAFPTDQPVTIS